LAEAEKQKEAPTIKAQAPEPPVTTKSDEPTVVENSNVEKHEESSETVEKTDNSVSVTHTSVSQVSGKIFFWPFFIFYLCFTKKKCILLQFCFYN
jgi:hypothetical protein